MLIRFYLSYDIIIKITLKSQFWRKKAIIQHVRKVVMGVISYM